MEDNFTDIIQDSYMYDDEFLVSILSWIITEWISGRKFLIIIRTLNNFL
jgi:hypothetical protein